MIRTLLATTALAALLTTGAIAQDAAPAAPTPVENAVDNAADAVKDATDAAAAKDAAAATQEAAGKAADAANNAANNAAVAVDNATRPQFELSTGYTAVDTDNLGTRLIGQSVFSSTGDDAEDIGKITDIVFDDNGQIVAAIIGVGGFLGLGEKSVAVDFRSLEFTIAADNTERWVVPTTAEALNAAPDFVWLEDEPAPAPADAMAPAAAPAAPATN
ncbi:PRC-barrel domain-containing protein [Devosia sp. A369]